MTCSRKIRPSKLETLICSSLPACLGRRFDEEVGFGEQRIAFVLRQAEAGTSVAEVRRKAGISEAAFYN